MDQEQLQRNGQHDCVEVAWTKSSYSSNDGPACVEVASCTCHEEGVLVRDSKDPDGPHLTFAPDSWNAFVEFAAAATV